MTRTWSGWEEGQLGEEAVVEAAAPVGRRRSGKQLQATISTMGRGKIEIKMIQNSNNRQVTYSKRKGGLLKKARELTVLCDAHVCLLMLSSTRKFCEYCSPSTDMKAIFERYQKASGNDVWEDQYRKMQKQLWQLKETNTRLRREIRQKMGEELEDLDFKQLRSLEQDLEDSLTTVRERKEKIITSQTETFKKKVKSSQDQHRSLMQQLHDINARLNYGYEYEAAVGLGNHVGGGPHLYGGFRVEPSQPNLHGVGYGFHELRLA